MNMKPKSYALPDILISTIEEVHKKTGLGRSEIIRACLSRHLENDYEINTN